METSEVLNKAADLIEERGWGQGPASMFGQAGICAMGAINLAAFNRLNDDYLAVHHCPAGQAVYNYLEGRANSGWWDGADRIWSWNDDCADAAEVIEVLRAAAVIEAAKERADVVQPAGAMS